MIQSSVRSKKKEVKSAKSGNLKWWQLSLLGIGCTIGTGYFLGSGLGIKITGPSIVISFLLAAAGTYIVYHLLAMMTTADPLEGSFCFYADLWAGSAEQTCENAFTSCSRAYTIRKRL